MYRSNLPILIISGLLMFGAGYFVGTTVAISKLRPVVQPVAMEAAKDQSQKNEADIENERHRRAMDSCSGIYEFDHYGSVKCLDLRSDGTGIGYQRQKYSSNKYSQRKISWWLDGENKITIGNLVFKVEGYDLIDSENNRWTRERF